MNTAGEFSAPAFGPARDLASSAFLGISLARKGHLMLIRTWIDSLRRTCSVLPSRRRRPRRSFAPIGSIDALEARTLLSAITVTSNLDTINASDGVTTLREAIIASNTTPGADSIDFNIPGAGPATIVLTGGALPNITDQVEINGLETDGSGQTITIDAALVGTTTNNHVFKIIGSGTAGSSFHDFTVVNASFTISATGSTGLTFENLSLDGAVVLPRTGDSLVITGGTFHTVRNVSVSNRSKGIKLIDVTDSLFESNVGHNTSFGDQGVSGRNRYIDNDFSQSHIALSINGSLGQNVIEGNNLSSSDVGVDVRGGTGNIVRNNDLSQSSLSSPSLAAMRIWDDTEIVISGNDFAGSRNAIQFNGFHDLVLQPDGWASPPSDPYTAWTTLSLDVELTETTGNGFWFATASNVVVRGFDLSRTGSQSGIGVRVDNGTAIAIDEVNAANRQYGVWFENVTDSTVTDNDFQGAWALERFSSGRNVWARNDFTGTGLGLNLAGTIGHSTVSDNNFNNAFNAVTVSGSSGNRILNNNMSGQISNSSSNSALRVIGVSDVEISDNNFTNSARGIRFENLRNVIVADADGGPAGFDPTTGTLRVDADLNTTSIEALTIANGSNVTVEGFDLSRAGATRIGTGLLVSGGTNTTVREVTIGNRLNGILANATTGLGVHCSSIIDNTNGLNVFSSVSGVVASDNHFEGNSAAIRTGTGPIVIAENNYWGAVDGPSNLGGSGDGWVGNVDADPFLTALPECLRTNLPPVIAANSSTVSVGEGATAVNSGTWSDPDDDDTVTLTASIGTVVQNVDGTWNWSFDTNDGPDQSQTVTITATDIEGEMAEITFSLTVLNVAPAVSAASSTVTVDEGQTAVNSGTFSDPGLDTVALSASAGTIIDNGNGTWSWSLNAVEGPGDSQTVTVTATDSDGTATSVTFGLVVRNVAPVISSVVSGAADVCDSSADGHVSVSGSFADPGVLDTHTVLVNWGDGSPLEAVNVDQATNTFSGSHFYADGGIYRVSVIVTDDDGDSSSAVATTSVIQGVGLVDGVLYVIGTDGKDVINIRQNERRDRVTVNARLDVGQKGHGGSDGGSDGGIDRIDAVFSAADVELIVVYGCDGDDQIHLGGGESDGGSDGGADSPDDVSVNAIIYGGAGNDHIRDGQGNDYIDGGEGDDRITGRRGDDIIVDLFGDNRIKGGYGNDTITTGNGDDDIDGNQGDDLIIAGGGRNKVDGGHGNDTIITGSGNDDLSGNQGNDVISGGEGDDRIDGGHGRDVLIGGTGADRIDGNHDDDLLIGGSTANEDDDAALDTALAAWASDDLAGTLLSLGTISDDGDKDDLTGGKSTDHLIGGASDKLKQ